MGRALAGWVGVVWLCGCGASTPPEPGPAAPTAPGPGPSASPPIAASASVVDRGANVRDAPPLPPEEVVPAVSVGDPRDLAWTGHGSVMVKVPGAGRVKSFYLDRTEVSELSYRTCYAHRCYDPYYAPGTLPGDPRNAVLMDLEDAKKHCKWAGKRLPTFAELELAAGDHAQADGALEPKAVDAGAANDKGIFGLDNQLMEWTSTPGEEKGYQRVFGLPDIIPEVPFESTRFGVRCAADVGDVKPLPPSQEKLELLAGWGMCARINATRETWCWAGLPGVLGGSEPTTSRQPVRVADLDTVVDTSPDCGLWPDAFACAGDQVQLQVFEVAENSQFAVAFGGGYLLAPNGALRLLVPFGDGTGSVYVPPSSSVKEIFSASFGLLTIGTQGEATWGGLFTKGDSVGEALRAAPIQLPGKPSVVLSLEDEECLRIGTKLFCGRFRPGRFEVIREVDKPVAAIAVERGAYCVLLDAGTLHCAPGRLTSSVLARALPPPMMKDVDHLSGGLGMVCARSGGSVHCWPRALQHQVLSTGGLGSQRIRFERIQIPEAR